MIPEYATKCLLYDEFTQEYRNKYFDLKRNKFIHNIDTLYYTVELDCEYNENENVKYLLEYLEHEKNNALDSFEEIQLSKFGDYYTTGLGFGMYAYSFEKKDNYLIFFARKKATPNTPEVLVQIRSENLWLNGEHAAVQNSFLDLSNILDLFDLKISNCKENRIDFAYHTNYIQDPLNFFKEENLNRMQVSRFTRWDKQGRLIGQDLVECDYISLGRRKSNNTFLRIYNKSQEVVNLQYKQFFLNLWYENNMISFYDFYIYEKCFIHGSYNYLNKARLEFYIQHGKNKDYIKKCKKLVNSYETIKLKQLADVLTPKPTVIVNVEIQTKRKFYASMDKSIDLLNTVSNKDIQLIRLSKILDNKDLFHDFITTDVIRFVDWTSHTRKSNCDNAYWWNLLRNVKMYNVIDDDNRELIREYQKNLDIEAIKKRTVNSLSTLSIYLKKDNSDKLGSDLVDFLSILNETDIEKAISYKKKKSALLKNRLQNLKDYENNNSILIIDSETAEILN